MANLGWLIAAIVLFLTSVLAIIISISARKIDFGDRIIRPGSRPILSRVEKRKAKVKAKGRMSSLPPPSPAPPPPSSEEVVYDEKAKAMRSERIAGPEKEVVYRDEYTGELTDVLTGGEPPREKKDESWEPEEMAEEADEYTSSEPVTAEEAVPIVSDVAKPESIEKQGYSRDLSIQLPKNMCLEEVFRLKITLIRSEEFEEELALRDLEVDKKEAAYFSLTVAKL